MKTNRELNTEHEAKQLARMRPKPEPVEYKWQELDKVIKAWIRKGHE